VVRERIEQFPLGEAIVRQDARRILRIRLFPNPLPYLVYYGHAKVEPILEIYLVRLYASGQRRPRFSVSEWPW